jgi:AMMECR1 domain-containing protein
VTCRAGGPMLLPQIIEQRQALFEFFDILVHGAVLPPETSLGEGRQPFQGTRVGGNIFLETQGPKDLQNRR